MQTGTHCLGPDQPAKVRVLSTLLPPEKQDGNLRQQSHFSRSKGMTHLWDTTHPRELSKAALAKPSSSTGKTRSPMRSKEGSFRSRSITYATKGEPARLQA